MTRPLSIRWRFVLWLGFLLTAVLVGFALLAYQLQRMQLVGRIDEELKSRLALVSSDVRGPPMPGDGAPPEPPGSGRPSRDEPGNRPRRPAPPPDGYGHGREGGPPGPPPEWSEPGGRGPMGERGAPGIGGPQPRLTAETLRALAEPRPMHWAVWKGGTQPALQAERFPNVAPIPAREGKDTQLHFRTVGDLRQAWQYTERGDLVFVGRSTVEDFAELNRLGWAIAAAGMGVLALGLGGGWWIAGRALRPLQTIGATAQRIARGDLAERIPTGGADHELAQLVEVLNTTFARLDAAFAEQKQFTANAAHELRTPLAVIIAEAQTALSRERTAVDYRETVEACLETAQQMRRLMESLLQLARFDAGQETMERQPVDLADVARASADLVEKIASARDVRIERELAVAEVSGDFVRLGQVATNLLNNALQHAKEHGVVRLRTEAVGDETRLVVSDDGEGVAASELPRIFERFYRADRARTRSDGRCGLGLTIARSIVEAHGGRIAVESEPGRGATFTVWLPGLRQRR